MRAMKMMLAGALALVAACGSDSQNGGDDARPGTTIDAGLAIDAAPGEIDASCFMNPTTHYEIINGCTTADSYDKHPELPGVLSDGGLPPLP